MAKAFDNDEADTTGTISLQLSMAEIALIELALSDYEKLTDSQKSIFLGALTHGDDLKDEVVTTGERARLVSTLHKGFASIRSDERAIQMLRYKLAEAIQTIVEDDAKQLGLNLAEN